MTRYIFKHPLSETKERWGYSVCHGLLPAASIVNSFTYLYDKNKEFFFKLEQSILNKGILNPILVSAGRCADRFKDSLPREMKESSKKILVCDQIGGSRLSIAKKHNLIIQCIIVDWINRFPNLPKINNTEDLSKLFNNQPGEVYFDSQGFRVSPLEHIHMEDE